MKRTIKNILMILVILILVFLTYFTLGYLKNNKTLNNTVTEFRTSIVFMNEENETSTVTIDEDGNITTTVQEQTGEGTDSIGEDPDAIVSSEDEVLYSTTEEQVSDTDLAATTGMTDDMNIEKSLNTKQLNLFNISITYLIAFCGESLLFSLILSYLGFSKFNKLTLKETFYSTSRLILYILYII